MLEKDRTFQKGFIYFALCLISFLVAASRGWATPSNASTIPGPNGDYLRVNQIGYLSADTKVAIAFSNSALSSLTFSVINNSGGATVFGPAALVATTAYKPFNYLYNLNFSTYAPASSVTCYVELSDGTKSVTFGVGPCAYQNTEETALNFFRAENCGPGQQYSGGACHVNAVPNAVYDDDGIVIDGPNAGQTISTEGGLHDSGDWIKFMITAAWVDQILLFSYQQNPTVFQDNYGSNLQSGSNGVPDVLDETRYVARWIIEMNPNSTTFYYDVADGRDHNANFGDLPVTDTCNYDAAGTNEGNGDAYGLVAKGYRPVYGGTNGTGDEGGTNNCARAAAALAMCYQVWNASGTSFQDTAFAGTCLTHAEWLYSLAKAQNYEMTDVDQFYVENTFSNYADYPEMEMAAVQLYKATGTASYLTDAESFAPNVGSASGELDWDMNNFLAHYCLYQVDASSTLLGYMQADLNADLAISNASPYGQGYDYVWGTNENLSSIVAMWQMWKKIEPTNTTYDQMGTFCRDFILGRNPWGCCFIQGMGTVYSLHPQHNIAMAIYPTIINGAPVEGPDTYQEYKGQDITLSNGTDPYGAFDNNTAGGGWCYHDDNEDYVTNEVTTSQAAWVVNFFANLSAQCSIVNTSTPTVTQTRTATPATTATMTATLTHTLTLTATLTVTATQTTTSTATPTGVLTNTSTPTVTLTVSATRTPSYTLTPTAALSVAATQTTTSTATPSAVLTNTSTPTFTLTATGTPLAPTATPTFSSTVTSTLTSASTVFVPSTPTETPTVTSTPTRPAPVSTSTATSSVTASDTTTSTPGANSPTSTFTTTFTATSTATLANTATPALTFTPTFTLSATPALTNCPGVSVWSGNYVAYRVGQLVGYDGELYECIQSHTSQPGWTPPAVPALWKDQGRCGTTPTLTAQAPPVVYPNPATGSTTTVQLADLTATTAKVQIFTVSFREVQTVTASPLTGGNFTVALSDKSGIPLADGLYYFVIQSNGSRWVNKVLVLR